MENPCNNCPLHGFGQCIYTYDKKICLAKLIFVCMDYGLPQAERVFGKRAVEENRELINEWMK